MSFTFGRDVGDVVDDYIPVKNQFDPA